VKRVALSTYYPVWLRIFCDYFRMKGYETVSSMSSVISVVAMKENLTKRIERLYHAKREARIMMKESHKENLKLHRISFSKHQGVKPHLIELELLLMG